MWDAWEFEFEYEFEYEFEFEYESDEMLYSLCLGEQGKCDDF